MKQDGCQGDTAGKNVVTTCTLARSSGGVPAEQDRQMDVETKMFVPSVIDRLPASDPLSWRDPGETAQG